jgi:hypothetical protein
VSNEERWSPRWRAEGAGWMKYLRDTSEGQWATRRDGLRDDEQRERDEWNTYWGMSEVTQWMSCLRLHEEQEKRWHEREKMMRRKKTRKDKRADLRDTSEGQWATRRDGLRDDEQRERDEWNTYWGMSEVTQWMSEEKEERKRESYNDTTK